MTAALRFVPVTEATRTSFEAFFASPGAPHYCWCMVWRRTTAESHHHKPADRKKQMMQRIAAGTPVGLLAERGGETVGWVSVAPRDTYRNLGGPEAKPGEAIWSIACFFVPRKLRGEGLIRRLIAGAVDHARANGATLVEAYPVPPDAPSYRFMGFVPTFAKAGFTDIGMAGTRRHVMRLKVRQPGKRRRLLPLLSSPAEPAIGGRGEGDPVDPCLAGIAGALPSLVMAGLVPAIHALIGFSPGMLAKDEEDVDHRDKPGDDGGRTRRSMSMLALDMVKQLH